MGTNISLCMIARDEEKNIRRCLNSVFGAVDEIIVVDTGSTDATCQIAREYGAVVQSFLWNDNFSDARNTSLELATGNWILFLDADEELSRESAASLRQIADDENSEGFFIRIINYLGTEGWTDFAPDLVFRMFRNKAEYRFHGAVHEQIVDVILARNKEAKFKVADRVEILHYGYLDNQIEEKDKKQRNLQIVERAVAAAPDDKLLRYHYGVELYRAERYEQSAAELIKAAEGLPPQTLYLPKLLRYLTLAYRSAHKEPQALGVIDLGLKLYPDYADLYYYKGIIHYEGKEYGRAYAAFQRALATPEQQPYYSPFHGTRGFRSYYHLGQVAEKFENQEEAVRFYILSLRDNPSFTPALEAVTRLLEPREEPDYAEKALGKICEFCTSQANLLMAQILFQQNAYSLTLKYLDRAIPQEQVLSTVSLWKAVCLTQERRIFEALRLLEEFGEDHPLSPHAKINKMLCFWLQDNRQKVRSLAEELFSLGLAQDTGAVIGLFRDALTGAKAPEIFLGEEGTTLLMDLLTRVMDLGEWEKAESLLVRLSRQWLKENALSIGRLYYRFGNSILAEKYISLYLKTGQCAEAYAILAKIKAKGGLYLEASEFYRQAISLEPGEPAYHLGLINAYETMRQRVLKQITEEYADVPYFAQLKEGFRKDASIG